MLTLACFLLAASTSTVDLVDEVYRIPANEWRYVEVNLKQQPAVVRASFRVESGPGSVRLALLRRDDLARLREGLPHGVMDETGIGSAASLAPLVRGPGEYVVVVDNQAGVETGVRLKVSLDFSVRRGPEVTLLSRRRQLAVILISFAVFFGIVTWSAHRLLRNLRRPPR
jgi:hypothetical protein